MLEELSPLGSISLSRVEGRNVANCWVKAFCLCGWVSDTRIRQGILFVIIVRRLDHGSISQSLKVHFMKCL